MVLLAGCQKPAEKKAGVAPAKKPEETLAGMKQDLRRADIDKIVTPVPPFIESCAIGGTPGPDGTVTGEEKQFHEGHAIYLTERFQQSPAGLQASIRMYDAKKQLVVEETRAMNGAKVATFTIAPAHVTPGFYRIRGTGAGTSRASTR